MAVYIPSSYFPLLAAVGEIRTYPAGRHVFMQEEKAENIYIVASGRVRAGTTTKDGHEITFEILRKGRIFGDASFLSHSRRSASITAVTDAEIIICSSDSIIPLLQKHRDLLLLMLQHLTDTCNMLSHQIIRSRCGSAIQKTADLLLELSETFHGAIPYTHENIAESLGLNRVTVSRTLSVLQKKGAVHCSYGSIRILNAGILAEILEEPLSR